MLKINLYYNLKFFKMKHILVIGSGARECMIIKKLKQSNQKITISCIGTTRNPYIDKNTLTWYFPMFSIDLSNLKK